MSVAKKLAELRQQGDAKLEAGDSTTAVKFFKDAIGVFLDNRSAEPDSIEEFVKVSGTLCVCYYNQKDLDNCFTTARELISTFPIIPKAFGAIGMCIVDRLVEQNEEMSVELTGEDLRKDCMRYVVKVGGVQCSADEAHTYLARAVLLSEGELQVSLGPYIEKVVRFISEQVLSSPPPIERQMGKGSGVLDATCPRESVIPNRPNTLSTSEVQMKPRIRLMDAMTGSPVDLKDKQPTQEEMESVMAAAAAQDPNAVSDSAQASPSTVAMTPADFMLSGKAVPVHVCHSERRGLPRGLSLTRAEVPFAISNWMKLSSSGVAGIGGSTVITGGPDISQGEIIHSHIDPATGLEHGMVMMPDSAMHNPTEAPAGVSCVKCGKEGHGGYACNFTFCSVCEAVAFCSSECQEAYLSRHQQYECSLLIKLREVLLTHGTDSKTSGKNKKKSSRVVEVTEDEAQPQGTDSGSASAAVVTESTATTAAEGLQTDSDVLPGSGWKHSELKRILPLCFSIYGAIQLKHAGWEDLVAAIQRGVQRAVKAWIPESATQVFEQLAPSLSDYTNLPKELSALSPVEFLTILYMVARLYCSSLEDVESCTFYVERLQFRHSCEPNCCWSDALRSVVTTRFVYKGEELTMTVDPDFPQHWPLQIRRKWLSRFHFFTCYCARCLREESKLNAARGELSNDLMEQLLTADTLHREGAPARHPTQYFHPLIHKLIPLAVLEGPKAEKARAELAEVASQLPKYLLPSHYLYEDLRRAAFQIALQDSKMEEAVKEGRSSLLFLEAMWPGGIPAKMSCMRDLPRLFDGRRRTTRNRQIRRSATKENNGAAEEEEGKGSPEKKEGARPATSRRRPKVERDYSDGTIVDQYIGSYHAWYCM